jgi:hypothetical protein
MKSARIQQASHVCSSDGRGSAVGSPKIRIRAGQNAESEGRLDPRVAKGTYAEGVRTVGRRFASSVAGTPLVLCRFPTENAARVVARSRTNASEQAMGSD